MGLAASGQVYFRNTDVSKAFVREWVKRLLTSGHLVYDQEAFNQARHLLPLSPSPRSPPLPHAPHECPRPPSPSLYCFLSV